jgi:micrococcal nuclease
VYTYKVEVIKVVDGDTIDVDIDLGFKAWVRGVRLRFDRINAYETRLTKGTTPEMKEKGLEAKELVKKICDDNPTQVTITTTKKGKYGRWIAEVNVGDINLNDLLVDKGLAVLVNY